MTFDLPTMSRCVDKLMGQLVEKKEELRRREKSEGKGHDVRKMNRLRDEIQSLEKRLSRAERLQDEALSA